MSSAQSAAHAEQQGAAHASDYLEDDTKWRQAFKDLTTNLEFCVHSSFDFWSLLEDDESRKELESRTRLLTIVKGLAKHEDRNTRELRTILHSWIVTVARWVETDEERFTQRFAEIIAGRLAATSGQP